MSQSIMSDPWDRIIERWRSLRIPIRSGVSIAAIGDFERKYNVVMPRDLVDYFTRVDGTGQDMDDWLYRFWPLNEIRPVHQVLADTEHFKYLDRFTYPDCFVFADHCISCWDYAVRITDSAKELGPVFRVTGGQPPGEQLATSFREFMIRYADDPKNIF